MRSFVSAIIPSYNCAAYIAAAVQSVLIQTEPVGEVIVVDDGSSDGTQEALAGYRDRIRYFRQPHRGASAARNHALSVARGDWVAFLDADDVWEPNKLERQLRLASRHPEAVVIYGRMVDFCENGRYSYVWPTQVCETPGDPYYYRIWACLIDHPPTSTVLARSDALRKAGGFDPRLATAEDLDLWVRVLSLGPFVGLPDIVARRRKRAESLTHVTPQLDQYDRYLKILRSRRACIRSWSGNAYRGGLSAVHTAIANVHMRQGRRAAQIVHAMLGAIHPNPRRGEAIKILLDGICGPRLYAVFASLAKTVLRRVFAAPPVKPTER